MAFVLAMLLNLFRIIGVCFYRIALITICITIIVVSLLKRLEFIGKMDFTVWMCFFIIFNVIIQCFIDYYKKDNG